MPHFLALVVLFSFNPVQLHKTCPKEFPVQRGWYNGTVVKFVPVASSNQSLATQLNNCQRMTEWEQGVQFAPKLNCALDEDDLGDVYMINGLGDVVFSASPNRCLDPSLNYTPLWRVHTFASDPTKPEPHFTSVDQVLDAINDGTIKEVPTNATPVLDATIVADSTGWKIPQALHDCDPVGIWEEITLPTYVVANGLCHGYIDQRSIPILDASNAELAAQLGANYAPRLANIEPSGTTEIKNLTSRKHCANITFAFTWSTAVGVPPGQDPVIDQVPGLWNNFGPCANQQYSPVRDWELFSHDSLVPTATYYSPNAFLFLGSVNPSAYVDLDVPIITNSPVLTREMNL